MTFIRRFSFLSACLFLAACNHPHAITQDELVRRSQAMMDAVPAGNQAPWKQYIADDVHASRRPVFAPRRRPVFPTARRFSGTTA